MDLCQLLIQANYTSIFLPFVAFGPMFTSCAVFADMKFFCTAITVTSDRLAAEIAESPSAREDKASCFILLKVYCTVRIILVFGILYSFLEHRELHKFLHAMFFAVKIIVI